MTNQLLNDIRLAGFAVCENDVGALQIEGDNFIIEYEFKRYWLYAKDEVGGIDYVDEFHYLDAALEGARLLQ